MKEYFAHETAVLDEGCQIGKNTKIWHFTHVMPQAVVGENCVIGQNVMIANRVTLGNNVKVQNNVSVYEGVTCENDVFLGPSMVFTNVINPRAFVERKHEARRYYRSQRHSCLRAHCRLLCDDWSRGGRYARCA